MENVVIYTKEKKSSNRLFIAKNANINNNNSVVSLKLKNGSGYTFSKDSLKMVDYETMEIYQNLKSNHLATKISRVLVKFSKIPKKREKFLF